MLLVIASHVILGHMIEWLMCGDCLLVDLVSKPTFGVFGIRGPNCLHSPLPLRSQYYATADKPWGASLVEHARTWRPHRQT